MLILEYKNLLNRANKIAINIAVIIITDNKTLLSWINLQANSRENNAKATRPTYPLSLSSKTVAKTSLGLFVCVARSMLRIRSPPIVEGRNKLKNTPPANEIITLFRDR